MSDIHGEHEAFLHILNSGSGEIKEKLEELFATSMTQRDMNDLATLIYYPTSKLALVADEEENLDEWYRLPFIAWWICAGLSPPSTPAPRFAPTWIRTTRPFSMS